MHKALLCLDETHAAHVGGKIEDVVGAFCRPLTGVQKGEVELQIIDIAKNLVPLVQGLAIDRANPANSSIAKGSHHVPADEAAGSRHDDEIILLH